MITLKKTTLSPADIDFADVRFDGQRNTITIETKEEIYVIDGVYMWELEELAHSPFFDEQDVARVYAEIHYRNANLIEP